MVLCDYLLFPYIKHPGYVNGCVHITGIVLIFLHRLVVIFQHIRNDSIVYIGFEIRFKSMYRCVYKNASVNLSFAPSVTVSEAMHPNVSYNDNHVSCYHPIHVTC